MSFTFSSPDIRTVTLLHPMQCKTWVAVYSTSWSTITIGPKIKTALSRLIPTPTNGPIWLRPTPAYRKRSTTAMLLANRCSLRQSICACPSNPALHVRQHSTQCVSCTLQVQPLKQAHTTLEGPPQSRQHRQSMKSACTQPQGT